MYRTARPDLIARTAEGEDTGRKFASREHKIKIETESDGVTAGRPQKLEP